MTLRPTARQDVHGPAGTAVLFNLSVLHRASGCARTASHSTKERKSLQLYYAHREYQPGDRGTPESWAAEMRRWRIARPESSSAAAGGGEGAEAPGVNRDPDPGPTEGTLVAAARAESARRDGALILADTSIVPPSLWRDHHDPEARAFWSGPRVNPRSVAHAAGLERGPDLNRGRRRADEY